MNGTSLKSQVSPLSNEVHNFDLVKPFGKYGLLNTRSTAKNLHELHSRRDHNLRIHTIDHHVCLIVLKVKATLPARECPPDED